MATKSKAAPKEAASTVTPRCDDPMKTGCVSRLRPAKGSTDPGHRCYKCWLLVARADAKPVAVLVEVKAAPKPRKPSQNPRVLANRMVTARAKAIAARMDA